VIIDKKHSIALKEGQHVTEKLVMLVYSLHVVHTCKLMNQVKFAGSTHWQGNDPIMLKGDGAMRMEQS